MPDGSSSLAPVTKPGPSFFQRAMSDWKVLCLFFILGKYATADNNESTAIVPDKS
jgi:hypothetical protein